MAFAACPIHTPGRKGSQVQAGFFQRLAKSAVLAVYGSVLKMTSVRLELQGLALSVAPSLIDSGAGSTPMVRCI